MNNSLIAAILITISALFYGCSAPIPAPVEVHVTNQKIDYLKDIKPVLDKRCVSCHSCYNSPCQAKLSSFEGLDRGASKQMIYDSTRLSSMDPTRLFTDAQSTEEWHEKDFYSITKTFDTNESYNDSIMMHMLHDKKVNPEVIGSYRPEGDDLVCPKDTQEMGDYLEDKPNHGMPYGFPALEDAEYNILTQWVAQGAHGPTPEQQKKITSPSKKAAVEIAKWETFLNKQDAKHAVTARYLYEHLFLAHWHFKAAPGEFYEIVRSKTPSSQDIDLIPSLRPFDDPGVDKFYYRFRRIHSTIVYKTHMVVDFDDEKLARIKELFIEPKWQDDPHLMSYDTKDSANPFVTFYQIPVKSRYQFLLDNSHYIIMTFIRGPVCRGQMAVNVIHDQFWIMFQDPEHEITTRIPSFLLTQAENLRMPIESVDISVFDAFSDDYRKKYAQFYNAKQKLYNTYYPEGQGIEAIWKGNRAEDAPVLTIYRHYDSASVHRGAVGGMPRTMWLVDYPHLERIYYALVAGYDVYGNISHQTNVRRYMDYLRLEGELNFLINMPKERRIDMLKSWYIGDSDLGDAQNIPIENRKVKIEYKTEYPKTEFIENVVNNHILKSTNITFDDINYHKEGVSAPSMPKVFNNDEDIKTGFRALTAPGSGFIKHMVGDNINVMVVRVVVPDGKDIVGTIVINRWHDNVNSLFGESSRLNSAKDTLDIIPYSIGSYPNIFIIVNKEDLPDFMDILKNHDGSDKYNQRIQKYIVRRGDSRFWKTFDWFQNDFNEKQGTEAGLYDLNRYYYK